MMSFRRRVAAVASVAGLLALAACGSGASAEGGKGSTKLSVVGFSAPQAADDAIAKKWAQTTDGAGVEWQTSYGASGDQSRAVAAGLKADFVHFSLEGDVTRLVDAGLVDKSWNAGKNKGIVSQSVVVLVVRKGNPKHIQGWDDVVRPGVKIVTPNPGSSGSARWNILAAWGHVIANGGTEAEAKDFLTKFFEHTVALPGSGRDATTAFNSGTGDVLISYENEAILARASGANFDYVVPDDTLLIQNPGAVLKNANPKAKQWLDYLQTKEAQTEYARHGFRPLVAGVHVEVPGANDPSAPFPEPAKLLTIDKDFGGWSEASKKFFDEQSGIVPAIQKATGKQ